MPRLRRCILSKKVYEVCFRTNKGLPFVCNQTMKLILQSVIARAQRDCKIDLSHFLYMGNHPHMLVVTRDSLQFINFICEVKKQTTEIVKKFLGKKHLSLWQKNSTSVIYLEDIETIKERIAYFYNNPTRANLVDTIDRYPGLNTWEIFTNSENSIHYEYQEDCPWIQQPMVKALPCRSLTEKQDAYLSSELISESTGLHKLIIKPNIWMQRFVMEDDSEQVRGHNEDIVRMVRGKEEKYRADRRQKGIKVQGERRLRNATIDIRYRSKKFSPGVFVISKDKNIRKEVLKWYREFCNRCSYCYERWKRGDFTVEWPPGAYAPVGIPIVNLLAVPE